jgi:hypothetical protein
MDRHGFDLQKYFFIYVFNRELCFARSSRNSFLSGASCQNGSNFRVFHHDFQLYQFETSLDMFAEYFIMLSTRINLRRHMFVELYQILPLYKFAKSSNDL